jgi:hypothetical protein
MARRHSRTTQVGHGGFSTVCEVQPLYGALCSRRLVMKTNDAMKVSCG